jgi:periplasmic divalent cation tolerance protein
MYVVVMVTAANKNEARRIARGLVGGNLAACVSLTAPVESLFRWEGEIDKAKEVLLLVKTRKALLPAVIRKVKSLHSYTVPEIIALPILGGNAAYLEWINAVTK